MSVCCCTHTVGVHYSYWLMCVAIHHLVVSLLVDKHTQTQSAPCIDSLYWSCVCVWYFVVVCASNKCYFQDGNTNCHLHSSVVVVWSVLVSHLTNIVLLLLLSDTWEETMCSLRSINPQSASSPWVSHVKHTVILKCSSIDTTLIINLFGLQSIYLFLSSAFPAVFLPEDVLLS